MNKNEKYLQAKLKERDKEIEQWVKVVADARTQLIEARTANDFLTKRLAEEMEINRKKTA